jgi:hypothetical protein
MLVDAIENDIARSSMDFFAMILGGEKRRAYA